MFYVFYCARCSPKIRETPCWAVSNQFIMQSKVIISEIPFCATIPSRFFALISNRCYLCHNFQQIFLCHDPSQQLLCIVCKHSTTSSMTGVPTVVVVAFSSLERIWGECQTIHSPPVHFFFFLKWRLTHTHSFHSLCLDQSTVAQQTKCLQQFIIFYILMCMISCVWGSFATKETSRARLCSFGCGGASQQKKLPEQGFDHQCLGEFCNKRNFKNKAMLICVWGSFTTKETSRTRR